MKKSINAILISSREPKYQGTGDSYRLFQLKSLFIQSKVISICKPKNKMSDFYVKPPSTLSKSFNLVKYSFSDYMLQSSLFVNNRVIDEVSEIILSEKPDLVIVELVRLAPLAIALRRILPKDIVIGMDFIDNYFLSYSFMSKSISWPKSFIYKTEAARALKTQNKVIEDLNFSMFVTSRDASPYSESKKVFVLPFIMTTPYVNILNYQFNASAPESKILNVVFSGNMSYYPNKEAFYFIVDDLAPAVKNVRFFILGRGITKKMRRDIKKHNVDNVFIIGEVKDMTQALKPYDVLICPVKSGSGVQIKILEAVSSKLLVVASSHSAEGTAFSSKEILVADTVQDYINIFNNIKNHKIDVNQIKSAALSKLISYYSFTNVKSTFINILSKVM